MIKNGTAVSVLCADGSWRPAVALSSVEPTHRDGKKIHDFPVIWVRLTSGRLHNPIPWPAESVRRVVEVGDA